MRIVLAGLSALLISSTSWAGWFFEPDTREAHPYAAASTCATADRTPGALLLVELTPDSASCAQALARTEPQVFLVAPRAIRLAQASQDSADLASQVAARVPGKVLAVGPRMTAAEVAWQLSIAVQEAADQVANATGEDVRSHDISPEQAIEAGAKRFGWRLLGARTVN